VTAHSSLILKARPFILTVMLQALIFRPLWGTANESSGEGDLFPWRFENTFFFTCALLFGSIA